MYENHIVPKDAKHPREREPIAPRKTNLLKINDPMKTNLLNINDPMKTNLLKINDPVKTNLLKINDPMKTNLLKINDPMKTNLLKINDPMKTGMPNQLLPLLFRYDQVVAPKSGNCFYTESNTKQTSCKMNENQQARGQINQHSGEYNRALQCSPGHIY